MGESQPQEARISVRRQPGRDLARDIVAGSEGAEALGDLLSHRREVHRLALELAPREARELDELPHELLHVTARRGEAIESGAPLSVESEAVVHDERLAQIIHAPERRAQVMRHRVGEGIDLSAQDGVIGLLGSQLGLEGGGLGLGHPLRRDVHHAHLDHEPRAFFQATGREAHTARVAITSAKAQLLLDRQRPSIEALDDTVEVRPLLEEVANVPGLDVLDGVEADHASQGLIALQHPAITEGVDDARHIGVEEGAIATLRLPPRLLRLPRPRQGRVDGVRRIPFPARGVGGDARGALLDDADHEGNGGRRAGIHEHAP